jgi:TolB protein
MHTVRHPLWIRRQLAGAPGGRLLLLTCALALGCGQDLAAPPPNGTIQVTTVTAGDPVDGDGYTVALDGGQGTHLGPNATVGLAEVPAGDHRVELAGIESNCVLAGPNPRSVTVSGGNTAQVSFELACSAPSGSIEVTTTTTGVSPDPDGYAISLDNGSGQPIASSGTIRFASVTAGDHRVGLTGIAPNCRVTGDNPQTVTVGPDPAAIAFDISCEPPTGTLILLTVTGGLSPDLDGYTVALSGAADRPLGPNATLTLSGLPVGDVSIRLSGLAANCTLAGDNPRTVSISNGGLTEVAFNVGCVGRGESTILFTSDRSGISSLYQVHDDGSHLVNLTPGTGGCCGDWSPDGSQIVFGADDGISVMNADGSHRVSLGVSGANVRWSPDGQRILFTDGGTYVSEGTIQVMNRDGSDVRTLTTGGSPDWSPDGSEIVFERIGPCFFDICNGDIYAMAADGSQVRQLTFSDGLFSYYGHPAWSPDGRKIAYRRNRFGNGGLYTMNPDGSGSEQITLDGGYGRPVWSPDGSALAVAVGRDDDDTTELTLIPSVGGAGVVIASSPGNEYPGSWK